MTHYRKIYLDIVLSVCVMFIFNYAMLCACKQRCVKCIVFIIIVMNIKKNPHVMCQKGKVPQLAGFRKQRNAKKSVSGTVPIANLSVRGINKTNPYLYSNRSVV